VARWRLAGEPPRPRRLGHMLIFTGDIAAAEAFYTRVLGLRLSDRIPGKATFRTGRPPFTLTKTSEAVCMKNVVRERPTAARRPSRGGYHRA